MDLFLWDDSYNIGNKFIDYEHLTIVNAINNLIILMNVDFEQHKKSILESIKYVVKVTKDHFNNEEYLLKKCMFPTQLFEEHTQKHGVFVKKLEKWENTVEVEFTHEVLVDVHDCLINWWKHHILEEDRKYIPYIKDFKNDFLF